MNSEEGKRLKVSEETLELFFKRLEEEINFKPTSFSNDSFKVINQIQNRKFSMTIDNSNKHFRIELPVIKHTFIKKPDNKKQSNSIFTDEMYSRMFALDNKKEQPYLKILEQEHICRSNSYDLDDIKENMETIVIEIVSTLRDEVERLAIFRTR